ncbi:hypothetical protein DMX04_05155 [Pseudomonas koreensis]|nr:hypothetical protein DMX04_05155 [Pseudomonas koreensis]
MWQGDLSPLGCEAAPIPTIRMYQKHRVQWFTTASQPNGDKSPRHKHQVFQSFVSSLAPLPCRRARH